MWSESTVINPEAWSEKVEDDLCGAIVGGVRVISAERQKACASARAILAKAVGPQRVTLRDDGTATVEPVVIQTGEELATHEQFHADSATWVAAVKAQERAQLEELAGI